MNKEEILRGRILFKRVAQEGKRIQGRLVRCSFLLESVSTARVQVGFKVFARSMNAVRRNRVRRLMREAFTRERRPIDAALEHTGLSVRMIVFYKGADELDERKMRLRHMQEDIRGICKRVAERIAGTT